MEQILLDTTLMPIGNKVICDSPYDFTKDKLCLKMLMAFYNGVAALVVKGRATDIIYLGLCKALDSVLRDICVWRDMDLMDGPLGH
ncbi:rna-directed dna polymerase from mobile element jockey-like [Pitangus sulphuratus]|nr:rna-directed dna polymerase from mobile element jockey-like [Pitangus sulphuratus]